jgi:hypothetical protein
MSDPIVEENAAVKPFALPAIAALLAAGASADLPYGVGSWPEKGHGNHRAVVRVAAPADAVLARIEWRRRDRKPEAKAVLVFDAATGKEVTDVLRVGIRREEGVLVFRPQTAPGDYYVYYLPYDPGTGNFDDAGTYYKPSETAEPAWAARYADTAVRDALPRAEAVRIEARTEFDRMDPMEVVANTAEVQAILNAHPDAPYLLFPEDRTRSIRMPDDLPLRWTRSGPSERFQGDAQPGEWYPYQIGVWAARKGIQSLALRFSDLTGPGGKAIAASRINCLNTEGNDWLGRPIHPVFAVGKGMVRALWIIVDVPDDAAGVYRGSVTLTPRGLPESKVAIELRVAGARLADHGVGDLWRLSRLKWLDSKLGLEEEPVPPFTPVQAAGNSVRLLGRAIRFGADGLPAQITPGNRGLLASPMSLALVAGGQNLRPGKHTTATTRRTPASVERVTRSEYDGAEVITRTRTEFDGCITVACTLRASRQMSLDDVRLEMPMRDEAAGYLMGFSRLGGLRKGPVHWKWSIDHADNQVWIGDPQGGVQLTLQGDKDVWDVVTLRDAGLPASWCNGGKGGCDVVDEAGVAMIRATSGARTMKPGEEVAFRFRMLVTPLKPIDRNHWNWRYGGPAQGGNILHIHHATPENPYINYPFIEAKALGEVISATRKETITSASGTLTYPAAGQLNLIRGSISARVRLTFDPTSGNPFNAAYNQEFMHLRFPNQDELGFYWNVDVRGMRAYVRNGAPERNVYPTMVDASLRDWRQGQVHTLTLSWGATLRILVDGKLCAEGAWRGLEGSDTGDARLAVEGSGFTLQALKISSEPVQPGTQVSFAEDTSTLLLETFQRIGKTVTRPVRGKGAAIGGQASVARGPDGAMELRLAGKPVRRQGMGVNLYYTVRELTNHTPEMWALRSLGAEIFQGRETFIYSVEKTQFGQAGGGHPWLQEHLVSNYVPAWRQPLNNGHTDASIGTQGLSRWHNYYVEGMRWLMETLGLDGLYLDGIGYDREIMKRVARVMQRANPASRVNFHSGNNYAFMDWKTSPANSYMEHFPFTSNLWFGEMYDYDLPPDVWLVEMSGIPFGLTSEMLNYGNGGNPYRGMVFGMTGRQHPSAAAMWRFWDEFGIQSAEWLGYWSPRCPVKADRADVKASVYRKPGKTLIALGHWPEDASPEVLVRLEIDWQALGIDPAHATLRAPAISGFQLAREFKVGEPIPVSRGKGWLLELRGK